MSVEKNGRGKSLNSRKLSVQKKREKFIEFKENLEMGSTKKGKLSYFTEKYFFVCKCSFWYFYQFRLGVDVGVTPAKSEWQKNSKISSRWKII